MNGNRKFHSQSSGTGRELKSTFPKFGNGKGMKKSIPKIREREGNEKNPFGNGKRMKKSIPKNRERESEASILGNDRKWEFPLTPGRDINSFHQKWPRRRLDKQSLNLATVSSPLSPSPSREMAGRPGRTNGDKTYVEIVNCDHGDLAIGPIVLTH